MGYIPDKDLDLVIQANKYERFKKTAVRNAKLIRTQNIQKEATKLKPEVIDEIGKCEICGFAFKPVLQIHHILPISKFGNNERDNIICVCPNCHKTLHVLYKAFAKDKELNFEAIENEYGRESAKKLYRILFEWIKKVGEMLDFIENYRPEDSSKE